MRTVYRRDDMSIRNWLSITLQEDGDIIVGMFIDEYIDGRLTAFPSVEFCTIGDGGGRSPRTRDALRQLFEAIRLDNFECPIEDQPKDYYEEKST